MSWLSVWRLLLGLACLHGAWAVPRIIGPYPQSFYQLGTFYTANDITVIASQSDANLPFLYTVTDGTGAVHTVIMEAFPPTITYTKTLAGYVYRDGQLTQIEVCKARDSTLVPLDFPLNYTQDQITILQSMYGANPSSGHTVGHWALPPNVKAASRHLLDVWGDIGDWFTSTFSGSGGCGHCVTQDTFNKLNSSVQTLIKNAIQNQQAFESFATTTNVVVGNLSLRDDQLDTLYTSLQLQESSRSQQLDALQGAQTVIAKQVVDDFSRVNGAINTLQDSVTLTQNQLRDTIGNFAASEQSMFWALNNQSNAFTAALNNLSATLTSQQQYVQTQLRDIVRQMRDVYGQINIINTDQTRKDQLTLGFLQKIADQVSAGQYFPFIDAYPVPPAIDRTQFQFTPVDDMRFFYQSPGVGNATILNQMDLFIFCDTVQLFAVQQAWMTWIDFLELLGPNGCASTGTCICYAFTETSQCVLNTTGTGFDRILNTTTHDLSDPLAPCNGHVITASGINQKSIYNVSALQDLFSARCSSQVAGTKGYLFSITTNTFRNFTYNTNTPNCNIDFSQVMNTLINNFPGPEYLFFLQLPFSFRAASAASITVKRQLLGAMPVGPSYDWLPYQNKNGVDADCVIGYYMAYSADVLPVYVLSNPQESLGLAVSVDGGPTDTRIDAILSSQNRFGAEDYFVVVGEPDSAVAVYDIPMSMLPLAPWPQAREGQITYALFPNTSCTSLSCWLAYYNTLEFKQDQGEAVAWIFRQLVDPITGLCVSTKRVYDGSQCSRRDRFTISCTATTCSEVWRTWEYQVTGIRIPGNAIATVVYSTCPAVTVTYLPGAAVVTLSSIQSFPTLVKTQITGPCPATDDAVSIPGPGSYSFNVRACDAVASLPRPLPSNYWSNLTIYQLVGGNWTLCATAVNINVTVDRTQVIQDTGVIDALYTQTSTLTITDPVTIGVLQGISSLNLQMQQVASALAFSYQAIGLENSTQYTGVADLILSTDALINNTYNAFNASRANLRGGLNLTQALAGFNQVFFDAQANATAEAARAAQVFANETQLRNVTSGLVQQLSSSTATAVLASREFTEALIETFTNVTLFDSGVQHSLIDLSRSGGNSLFGGLIDGLGTVFEAVRTFPPVEALGDAIVTVAGGVANVATDVWNNVNKVLTAAADLAVSIMHDMASLFNILTLIVPYCIVGVVIMIFAAMILRLYKQAKQGNSSGMIIGKKANKKLEAFDVEELIHTVNAQTKVIKELGGLLLRFPGLDPTMTQQISELVKTPADKISELRGAPYTARIPGIRESLLGKKTGGEGSGGGGGSKGSSGGGGGTASLAAAMNKRKAALAMAPGSKLMAKGKGKAPKGVVGKMSDKEITSKLESVEKSLKKSGNDKSAMGKLGASLLARGKSNPGLARAVLSFAEKNIDHREGDEIVQTDEYRSSQKGLSHQMLRNADDHAPSMELPGMDGARHARQARASDSDHEDSDGTTSLSDEDEKDSETRPLTKDSSSSGSGSEQEEEAGEESEHDDEEEEDARSQ
jgi:uncharacterized membrane protein YgcG